MKFFTMTLILLAHMVLLLPVMSVEMKNEIHDPLNIFCGSLNCYNILEVERDTPLKDIKKAYRKLSLAYHPDKNKDKNATEVFRLISKAYEVLEGNESRSLFDYYLDHPRDYFKVSGQHYFRNLPKADVRLILVIVVLLISLFQYHYQMSKYQRVFKYLYTATVNNLSEKQGGSKQTIELYNMAVEEYNKTLSEESKGADKAMSKAKMLKDPEFEKIVKKIVGEVKVEGGYRKPKWSEVLAVQLFYLPWIIYRWMKKYYRRNISTEPYSEEEKLEMTIEVVGLGMWEEVLGETEKKKLLEMEIWKPSVREKWDELGLDILLDPEQLEEVQALRNEAELGKSSVSESASKKRRKVPKKPVVLKK